MTNLCDKCGKNNWTEPVVVGSGPNEQWCKDCIQSEVDAGNSVMVLNDYLQIKRQEEIMKLLNEYIEVDSGRFTATPSNPDSNLVRIRELLVDLWGEQ